MHVWRRWGAQGVFVSDAPWLVDAALHVKYTAIIIPTNSLQLRELAVVVDVCTQPHSAQGVSLPTSSLLGATLLHSLYYL